MIGFIILAAVIYGIYRLAKWYDNNILPGKLRKKQDRETEAAMLRGMVEAASIERVTQKLIDRYENRD